jgi:cytochrome b561
MSLKSDDERYGAVATALHWSIALLILCLLASGYLSDVLPKPTAIQLHKATGIVVLGLTALRVLWWIADPRRPGDAGLTWEKWPSRLVKWALIGLGLALPMSGWLMSSAADKPITLYGLMQIPLLVAPDKGLAHQFREIHETLALGLSLLLAMHVGGALRHHILLKDGILLRMMPWHKAA